MVVTIGLILGMLLFDHVTYICSHTLKKREDDETESLEATDASADSVTEIKQTTSTSVTEASTPTKNVTPIDTEMTLEGWHYGMIVVSGSLLILGLSGALGATLGLRKARLAPAPEVTCYCTR